MPYTKKIIGLMSGTSANGVDAALVEINGSGMNSKVKLIEFETYAYSQELKTHILDISSSPCTSASIGNMNFYLGEVFAEAAVNVVKKTGMSMSDIDIIGSHGQTISHQPCLDKHSPFSRSSTLQIGEPAVIAEKTGVTTVVDFRTGDMAAGGTGAPLTPYANAILFSDRKHTKIVQNIGGISNLTLLRRNPEMANIIAFDTGPGNMVIDGIMSIISHGRTDYDNNGNLARKGTVNKELLSSLMEHPFIKKTPPKATGREDFGKHFAKKVFDMSKKQKLCDEDIVATVTAFTIESIIANYEQFIFPKITPEEIIISGGGANNTTLLEMLKARLPQITITTSDKYNIPSTALEAVSFAILANDTMEGIPNNIPNVTGAKRKVVLGKIVVSC